MSISPDAARAHIVYRRLVSQGVDEERAYHVALKIQRRALEKQRKGGSRRPSS